MAHTINLNNDAPYAEHPGIVSRLGQSFAQYREYLATYSELNALSDRLLADIGLSRLDTREIARAAVYAS